MFFSSTAYWYRHVGDMHSLRTTIRIHFACITFVDSNHISTKVAFLYLEHVENPDTKNDRCSGPPVFQRMVQLMFFLSGNLHVRLQGVALLLP